MTAAPMIDSFPTPSPVDSGLLGECIDAAAACVEVCGLCAAACLSEDAVADLAACVRTDLDCADVCYATGRVLSRLAAGPTDAVRPVIEACLAACRVCAADCESHADHHEHCRLCAQACRRCEQACSDLLLALG